MVKKLTKHGNSLALILDKPILDLMKIDADTPLEISTDGKRLIIYPQQDGDRAFRAALEKVRKRFAKRVRKPRDPRRIPRIVSILQRAWEGNPDLRLTQLICNCARRNRPGVLDPST